MAAQRMSPVDAAWLHMDRPTNELVVTSVLWFEDRLDDAVVREAVEERLVGRHRRFAQRVHDTGAAAWWVDEVHFDAMTHVVREQLAQPMDRGALEAHVTAVMAQELPCDAPLWRIHVVDGYLGGTALIARIHHCIADGVALFRVLLAMSDEAQERPRASAVPSADRDPEVARGIARRVATLVSGCGKVAGALATLAFLPPDTRTSLRGPLSGSKTVRWSEPLPLQPVKQAARDVGVTVNDVVLAALSEALHRHLHGGTGGSADVRAVLPVDLRDAEEDEMELGNRFGLIFLRLPTATSDDSQRLATIRRRTTALKASALPVVALHILRVAGRFHRRLIQVLISVFSVKASVVVTNVKGPGAELHVGGCRLGGVIAWPPQTGTISTGVAVISYAGSMTVGLVTDDRVVPDSRHLLADLGQSLQVATYAQSQSVDG